VCPIRPIRLARARRGPEPSVDIDAHDDAHERTPTRPIPTTTTPTTTRRETPANVDTDADPF
jgi:hypothetical protein